MSDQPDAAWGKQFVKFSFFRVRENVRAAPDEMQLRLGKLLGSILEKSAERMLTRTYSTIGTRADTDFLVWQVADDLRLLTDWHAAMLASPLGAALERPHSYLSMTMRSIYENPIHPETAGRDRLREDGGVADYIFVYPMIKTRPWYALPKEERQRIMEEHIAIGHRYHGIQINTTYSFGLDDQEFVVAFEGNNPGEFLALVRDLRESESSAYTERDTPAFTCRRLEIPQLLTHIGLLRPSAKQPAGPGPPGRPAKKPEIWKPH